jgi:hypothetical protein
VNTSLALPAGTACADTEPLVSIGAGVVVDGVGVTVTGGTVVDSGCVVGDGIVVDGGIGEVGGAVVDGGVDVEDGTVDVDGGAGVGSCCARAAAVVVHTTSAVATNARVPVRAHRGQITASYPLLAARTDLRLARASPCSRTPSGDGYRDQAASIRTHGCP